MKTAMWPLRGGVVATNRHAQKNLTAMHLRRGGVREWIQMRSRRTKWKMRRLLRGKVSDCTLTKMATFLPRDGVGLPSRQVSRLLHLEASMHLRQGVALLRMTFFSNLDINLALFLQPLRAGIFRRSGLKTK